MTHVPSVTGKQAGEALYRGLSHMVHAMDRRFVETCEACRQVGQCYAVEYLAEDKYGDGVENRCELLHGHTGKHRVEWL